MWRLIAGSRLGRIALAAVAAAALVAMFAAWQREIGADRARDDIEEQDDDAMSAAEAAALGFAECSARSGVFWDFAAGECRRGAPGAGD